MYATQEDMDILLTAVNNMATRLEEQFSHMEERFDRIEIRLDRIEGRLDRVEQRLDRVEQRLEWVEKNMVHKSQFNSLLIILDKKQVITSFEKSHILFPPAEAVLS